MAFTLHVHAETAYNRKACDLIALIKTIQPEPQTQQLKGSWAETNTIDWSEKKVEDSPLVFKNLSGEKDIFEGDDNKLIGFDKEGYLEYDKLINTLYKNREISRKVTLDFLYNTTFKWAIDVYKTKVIKHDFISHLKNEIQPLISNYKYYFVVSNLHIEKPFTLGNMKLEFFNDEFYSKLDKNPEKKGSELYRSMYGGAVFATCVVENVEKGRGEEIAYYECCKGIDVLKTCSPTFFEPTKLTQFDIEKRVKVRERHDLITENLDTETILLNMTAGAIPQTFTENNIDKIVIATKNLCELISKPDPSELDMLLINALDRLSETLSQNNLNRRVSDLFTIWESLLLKDKSAPIADSLKAFGGYLLKVKREENANFESYIDHMYDIRCDLVHHAINKKFEINQLTLLQSQTVHLVEEMIFQSKTFNTKKELIEAIEKQKTQDVFYNDIS